PFEILAQYYMIKVLSDQRDGSEQYHPKAEDKTIGGLIFVYDGPIVLEKAKEMVNRPRQGFREKERIDSDKQFLDYFLRHGRQPDKDWVYFYTQTTGEVTRYKGDLRNNYPGIDLEEVLERDLPPDFDHEGGSVYDVGTRTGIAPIIPKAFPGVKVIILKESGKGKLALFDYLGLSEELFYDNNSSTIVYRSYRNEDGFPSRNKSGTMIPSIEVVTPVDDSMRQRLVNKTYESLQIQGSRNYQPLEPISTATTD
ncbi:MAG: hypothetical protein KKE20_06555, partial [Nanoarchaeota archaeon]|nr:hypothetical protein [Nanoarchaeota archaeon]